jgi:hypothetical protein
MATEQERREAVAEINANPGSRETLEAAYGQVWDTKQMQVDFVPHSFGAPMIIVTRKSDNIKGSLLFQHNPRFFYSFEPA